MNSGQEGNNRTKIWIHTVIFPKFGESEIQFFLFPLVLQSSVHVQSTIVPQKNLLGSSFTYSKGFMIGPSQQKISGVKLVT